MTTQSTSAQVNGNLAMLYAHRGKSIVLAMPYLDYVESSLISDEKDRETRKVFMSVLPIEGRWWENMDELQLIGHRAVNGSLLLKYSASNLYYPIGSKEEISETAEAVQELPLGTPKEFAEEWTEDEVLLFLLLAYKSGEDSLSQFVQNASAILNRKIVIVDGLFPPSTSAIFRRSKSRTMGMNTDTDRKIDLFEYFMNPILDKEDDLMKYQSKLQKMGHTRVFDGIKFTDQFSSIVKSVMEYNPVLNNLGPIEGVSSLENLPGYFYNLIVRGITNGIKVKIILDAIYGYINCLIMDKSMPMDKKIETFVGLVPDQVVNLTFNPLSIRLGSYDTFNNGCAYLDPASTHSIRWLSTVNDHLANPATSPNRDFLHSLVTLYIIQQENE